MKNQSKIIYHDQEIIIVNKTAGIATVADRFDAHLPYLLKWLNQQFGPTFTVHRLDTNTSGLICFARNPEEQKRLSLAFENRIVTKRYKAITLGTPQPEVGIIDAPIFKSETSNQVTISPKGKNAITHYNVEATFGSFSLVDLWIETGRTHQIRVHLMHIGNPLLVDPLYGTQDTFFLSSIKSNFRGDRTEERPLLSRTPLHAYELTIPMNDGSVKTFKAELPKDMHAVLHQLNKVHSRRRQR
ncbi:MAG: RluA family pseudouridine synthase [Saprospiraceae bacterium]|nr:RluA family pseudouridine synthase [Saprospiraceae bacterium]